SPNSEFYGNLSYYNGWMASDRNHGHGIYLQNITGTKLVEDNFVGDNADEGIQAYGSGAATITGITIQGNTLYNTSSWPTPHYQYNLVMGGGQLDSGNTITENMSFFTPGEDYGFFNIGQYTPGSNLTAINNVFVGGYIAVAVDGVTGPFVFTGNKVYNRPTSLREIELAPYSGQTLAGYNWDNNTYYGLNRFYYGTYDGSNAGGGSNLDLTGWQSQTGFDRHSTLTPTAPTGTWIYVRPNKYEAKRANITIYNWDLSSSVNVDLSGVLAVGDQYVIQDAQNFYGPDVASGTYANATVSIPMSGLSKATPVGFSAPAHTTPLLGTFIVMPTGAATPISQPTPIPVPTPTPTPTPTPIPTPPSGGLTGYTFCASENGTCSFTGTTSVAYGANGKINYQTLTGGTPCTNAVFGDPDYGYTKACYTQAVAASPSGGRTGHTFCDSEHGTCSFTGTTSVAYGANGKFNYQTLTGGTPCTNAVFGDPDYGYTKACYTQAVAAPPSGGLTGYTFCASENGTCSFTGTTSVGYGGNGKFNYQTLTGGTPCTNAVFGDPDYGYTKACYTQAVAASPSGGRTGHTFCDSEHRT